MHSRCHNKTVAAKMLGTVLDQRSSSPNMLPKPLAVVSVHGADVGVELS